MFPDIPKLKTLFETCKQNISIEQCDKIISIISDHLKDRNISQEFYKYCKEHKDTYSKLVGLSKTMMKRLEKKDYYGTIEGETGSGKSTLALCILLLLYYLNNKKFDLGNNLLYYPKENELSHRLTHLKEYEILLVDETIKSLNKYKWQNKDVIESNEVVQTERFRHNIVLFAIPSFYDLTTSFRNVNIKFRLWVISTEPSAVVLWMKEKHPTIMHIDGAWHEKERYKKLKQSKIGPLSNTEQYLKAERTMTNYIDDYSWPDIENIPEFMPFHLMYEVYKKRSRLIATKEEIPKEDMAYKVNTTRQKETIKGIMRVQLKKNPDLRFKDWYIEYGKECPLHRRTLENYWTQITFHIETIQYEKKPKILYNIPKPHAFGITKDEFT